MRKNPILVALGALLLAGGAAWVARDPRPGSADIDLALARTRKQVRMLDDIYKTTVVLITDKYVHDADDFPAGSAALALFAAIKEKGWHEVRLLDATGKPRARKNSPRDDFERTAIEALKSGETWADALEQRDGERYLRAATLIPVVSKKCILCHEHYGEAKEGEAIGALSYTLKVE
jgi:hypothetical protein